MGTILNLQRLSQAEQAKLVFHGIDPLESLERFLSLQELWRIRVQKILESAILIHWAVTVASVTGVCCNVTQRGLHVALTAEELLEKLLSCERVGRWRWRFGPGVCSITPIASITISTISVASIALAGTISHQRATSGTASVNHLHI